MWLLHLQGMLIYLQALFLWYDFTTRVLFEALEEASGVAIAAVVMLFREICNIIHHCQRKKVLAVSISKGRQDILQREHWVIAAISSHSLHFLHICIWRAGHAPYCPDATEPQSFVKTLLYPRTLAVWQFYAKTRILN